MFDQVVLWLELYPYLGVAAVFVLCGMGLPLPEEIVLLAAGYVCAKLDLNLWVMMLWCGGAITLGDLLPFVLGRVFGTRLLRLRWMRLLVTKRRLAKFDLWFRRRGDLVILLARFVAGLRMVAFFTAGVMKMPWRRFLLYDGIGILLIVPLLTWLGHRSQTFIDEMIENVQKVERGILWTAVAGGAVVVLWFVWWRRRRRRVARHAIGEAFIQPSRPVAQDSQRRSPDDAADEVGDEHASDPSPRPPGPEQPAREPAPPPHDDAANGRSAPIDDPVPPARNDPTD